MLLSYLEIRSRVVGPDLEVREEHRVGPPVRVDRDERQRGSEPPGDVPLGEAFDEGLREGSSERSRHGFRQCQETGKHLSICTGPSVQVRNSSSLRRMVFAL